MTREEAKEYIYECLDHSEATEIVKAFEQEPCEDAVSREKVWYIITGGKYSDESYEQFIDRLVEKLNDLPPVTPTHKVGKWIYEYDNGVVTFYHCSVCERKLAVFFEG